MADLTDNSNQHHSAKEIAAIEKEIAKGKSKHLAQAEALKSDKKKKEQE